MFGAVYVFAVLFIAFGLFHCFQKSSKLMGDEIDTKPNATPSSEEELKNKERKKKWQDENGFMHYPDGSVSASPVD